MTIPMEPRTPRLYHVREGSAFTAFGSIGVVCAATATMLVGAITAHSAGAPPMVTALVAQLTMLAVPLLAMRGSGRTLAALGIRRPRTNRAWIGAVMIGASAWYLNMRLVEVLPLRDEDAQLVELIDRPSTVIVILVVALTPAICEEVLFRGVLVRGLSTRFIVPFAILAGAILFSAYHLRVVQLVPTFTLGLVLGFLAMRADSALPGMVAHFMNNTIALLVARGDMSPLAGAIGGHPNVSLVVFAMATTSGIAITAARGASHE
jgi:sodium transport system permease protein